MAEPWKNDPVADAPWLQDAPKRTGLGVNIGAALQDATAGLAGLPVDLAQGAINLPVRGFNAVTGRNAPLLENSVMGSDWIKTQMGRLHPNADPRTIEPGNRFEAITRAGVGGTANAVLPGGLARALPPAAGPVLGAIQNAVSSGFGPAAGTIAGVASMAGNEAEQHVPAPYKPAANMGAQLAAGAAGTLAGRGLMDYVVGANSVTPERAAQARHLVNTYKMPLTTTDILPHGSPMKWLQAGLDYLPFSGAVGRQNRLQGAVNKSLLDATGGDEMGAAGTVFGYNQAQGAQRRIGGDYETALRNVDIPFQAGPDFAALRTQINQSTLMPSQRNPLKKVMDNIERVAKQNNGRLSGSEYQELRESKSAIGQLLNDENRVVRDFARNIRNALDQNFEVAAPHGNAELFGQANRQWRTLMGIAPELAKGEPGNIPLGNLQAAANRADPGRAFHDRPYPLGDMGDATKTFLRRLPESGTAPRAGMMGGFQALAKGDFGAGAAAGLGMGTAGAGAGAGAAMGGTGPGALGLMGVIGGGRLANAALNSKRLREALLNRVLNPQPNAALIPPWMMTSMPSTGLMGATNAQK